jgi:uncharacterized damage-inducible protein DinB
MTLSPRELLTAYRGTPRALRGATNGLDHDQLSWRRDESDWSVIEVIAHLADAEDNSHERVKRMLSDDNPAFMDYDEKAWARERDYRSKTLDEVLTRFCDQREAHIVTLMELDEAGWTRTGDHNTMGALTVASITASMICHDMEHLGQIADLLLAQAGA